MSIVSAGTAKSFGMGAGLLALEFAVFAWHFTPFGTLVGTTMAGALSPVFNAVNPVIGQIMGLGGAATAALPTVGQVISTGGTTALGTTFSSYTTAGAGAAIAGGSTVTPSSVKNLVEGLTFAP